MNFGPLLAPAHPRRPGLGARAKRRYEDAFHEQIGGPCLSTPPAALRSPAHAVGRPFSTLPRAAARSGVPIQVAGALRRARSDWHRERTARSCWQALAARAAPLLRTSTPKAAVPSRLWSTDLTTTHFFHARTLSSPRCLAAPPATGSAESTPFQHCPLRQSIHPLRSLWVSAPFWSGHRGKLPRPNGREDRPAGPRPDGG